MKAHFFEFSAVALLVAAHVPLWAAEPIPPPAWQRGNARLARRWELLTGKYIYQRACTSCHAWGPAHWPASRWKEYLEGFPANHKPDVCREYQDLTAMFAAGKMVPTRTQEKDALSRFILAAAPARALSQLERDKPFDGFPLIGSAAPNFTVDAVQGGKYSLAQLKDKKALVLVFSRAHW